MLKPIAFLFAGNMLIACSPAVNSDSPIKPIRAIDNLHDIAYDINKPFITFPSPNKYSICHGHSCNKYAYVSLSQQQWQTVTDLFLPPANNAEQERELIKQAIALLEHLTGEQVGTYRDKAKNATSASTGLHGQLDCIDEATNTTVYLRLLSDAKLLNFHQQSSRTARGGLLTPHNTATITEKNSGIRYAVDSWFDRNGQPPAIVPLQHWKQGWKPSIE